MASKRFFERLVPYRWWLLAAAALLLAAVYVLDDRPEAYAEARRAMRRAAAVMALQEAAEAAENSGNTREEGGRRGTPAGSSYLPYWALDNDTNPAGQATGDGLQSASRGQGSHNGAATDSALPMPSGAHTGGRGNGGAGGVDDLDTGRRVRTLGVPGR